MAKSKQPKIHYHEETHQPLIFDFDAFNTAVKQQAEEQHRSQKFIQTNMAEIIWPDEDPEVKYDTSKKWKNGKNGPRDLSDIRKMECFFNCSLLTPYPPVAKIQEEGKGAKMTTSNQCPPVVVQTTQIDKDERLAAQEMYCALSNLIANYRKLMINYASSETFPSAFAASLVCPAERIPEGFPSFTDIQCTLHKLRFNLPYSIYIESATFVDSIYGLSTTLDPILSDHCFDMTAEIENFTKYAQKYDLEIDDDLSLWGRWLEFAAEQAEIYYDTLDDIFDDYLK